MEAFLTDAYSDFQAHQPVAVEVISRAATRFHSGLAYYAVMGAGIERQLELETREYDKNIVQ